MTRAGRAFADHLRERVERFEASLETETDPIKRAVDTSWLDATKAALFDFQLAQSAIEAEAFFLPAGA